MKQLSVFIENNGDEILVGTIRGNDSSDAKFLYCDEYMSNPNCRPISISMPYQEKPFDEIRTRNYFEGLLPEGFTRRCVAENIKADENDYITILSALGKECLGAIKIIDEDDQLIKSEYIKLSDKEIMNIAQEGSTTTADIVGKSHLSLTGASGKVGLYLDEDESKWYLPIGDAPSTHIVKQSHVRLKKIVINEQLCMLTASKLGIDVPESFIINNGLSEDEFLFATKRYDRLVSKDGKTLNGLNRPLRLHQEDFAQALGISSKDKYEKNNDGYLSKMFDVIRNYSANPIEDQIKLWNICVFNYLIGNTDNHIKNTSLLYSYDMRSIRLAPAYDVISTQIYESSTENMSLSIGGIYNINKIKKTSFAEEAYKVGIGAKIAMKQYDNLLNGFEKAIRESQHELEIKGFSGVDEITDNILKNCRGL